LKTAGFIFSKVFLFFTIYLLNFVIEVIVETNNVEQYVLVTEMLNAILSFDGFTAW